MFDLNRTQRWMQAVIMHPDGILPGMLGPDARLQMDVTPDNLETVVTRSRSLSAGERLAIYGRAYHARLTECLRVEFAVLRHALGEELFDMFACAYLCNCPSRSFTLADLGKDFPAFLETTRPDQGAGEGEEQWANFVVDLARLERAFSEVFDGPGVERQQLLTAERVQMLSADLYAETRLTPVGCLRLFSFRYPVHEYFHSVRREQQPKVPLPAETFLAMSRRDYVVTILELSARQHALLSGLLEGQSLGQSLENAGESSPDQQQELITWIENWSEKGFFIGMEQGTSLQSRAGARP